MKSQSLPAIKSISIFGGSSATGKVLIKYALKKGLRVKTLVRYPDSLGDKLAGS